MTDPLTPALIGQHFKEGYDVVARDLHRWELAKAVLLVKIGRESLDLIRSELDKLPEHDLAGRKAMRAELVKAIEAELPQDCEGIGAPQLNRWIRWAGACELMFPENVLLSLGLKQAHLMTLETFVDQHEPSGQFRLKPSWKDSLDGMRTAIQACTAEAWSAKQLEDALDSTAAPQPQETPCQENQEAVDTKSESAPLSNASPEPKKSTVEHSMSPASASASTTSAGQSPTWANTSSPKASASTALSKPSPTSSTESAPRSTAPIQPKDSCASGATSNPGPCPADLADQAFKLLQNPEILAGVFRRTWKKEPLKEIVENLIRANGEDGGNALALATAMHRMRPFVLTYFEEYVDDGKYKLRMKDSPESPTLEQLCPAGELQEV